MFSKKNITLIVIFAFICSVLFAYFKSGKVSNNFRTAKIKRGDLLLAVSATGTIEPEEVIDVGAQVAGQIISFGKDSEGKTLDYGSSVTEGSVLANIDDSLYTSDVNTSNAQLKRALADLIQMKSKLLQTELEWKRAQKLGTSEALSKSSYENYRTNYEVAKATVTVGEAAIVQAKATLEKAERNLSYCVIKSPVNGVVIDRRVNIGQTVVSSLNTPSLFLLAKDLTKMQIWIAVNEADVGKIHPGQQVNFTVDTFPSDTFKATVRKIRLNATMNQNVVTYTVEAVTDNSSKKLLPYLTANTQFEIDRHSNVLQIPNVAVRWTPKLNQVAPEYREQYKIAYENPDEKNGIKGNPTEQIVWILKNSFVYPVNIQTGDSDNTMTEVLRGDLKEDMDVIVGEKDENNPGTSSTNNPFAPKVFKGRK